MGTMTTVSSRLSRQAEYEDKSNGISISLNYQIDEVAKSLVSIDGTLYKGENKEYGGRFNGRPDNGEIVYDTSGVKRGDMMKLYNALTDIEEQIAEEFNPVND